MSNIKHAVRANLKSLRELEFENIKFNLDDLKENQIYAETEVSAVSLGTEYSAYAGHPPLRPGVVYPRLLGYCNVARVVQKGNFVKEINTGDLILTHQSHQSAFVCKSEDALAVVPQAIAKAVSISYLAHLGLAAMQKTEFKPSENVAVLGLGVIGLATIGVAKASGANVLAIGNDDFRLKTAEAMGADECLRSEDSEIIAKINAATGGIGIDLLITTANSWSAWELALKICRKKSRIAVLGFPGRGEPPPIFNPLEPTDFYYKQLSIYSVGSVSELEIEPIEIRFNLRRNMQWLIQLVEQGKLPLENLITHRFAWQDLEKVYLLADEKDKSLISAMIEWK